MKRIECLVFVTTVVIATSFIALESLAVAGTLGKVGRSIRSRQVNSPKKSSPAPQHHGDRDPDTHAYRDDLSVHSTPLWANDWMWNSDCSGCSQPGGVGVGAAVHGELSLTYENVVGSDGAINGFFRLSLGSVGLAFNSVSFFESDRLDGKASPEQQTRITAWDVSLQARTLRIGDDTTGWIGLGLGFLHSNTFDTATGGVVSAHFRHSLSSQLHIDGSVRGMMYTDDIKAGEIRAGVTASVLHVGYRYLEFNAGPPLRGPEVGIALYF